MPQLLIRKSGTLIDVSPDGVSPLPQQVVDLLAPHLNYVHKNFLHGAAQYSVDGARNTVELETKYMFRMEQGRLTTGYGFIPKITHILQMHGFDVRYVDLSPEKPRADCYVPDWDNLLANFSPRERQIECLQAIANSRGGVIDAAMGFGKTHMFEALCWLYPRARIAIVVEPKDVAARIVRQLTKRFPGIGHIGGGNKKVGNRITVFTAGSMHHTDGDYDFLLCDEVHQLMAPSYSRSLGENFTATRNFGFSATLNARSDGADAKLEMFFGPVIFRLTYQEAVALGLVTPIHVRWINVQSEYNPAANKTGTSKTRWGIWRNDARNAAFANFVRNECGEDDQILMSVATVEHAIYLWRHLPEFALCYSNVEETDHDAYVSSGLIPPSFNRMTTQRREEMRNGFEAGQLKRVIATDVWSTGVDFEELQWLIRCDGRESQILSTQWPGRVGRKHEGKDCAFVVDSIDSFDKSLKRKSLTRRKHYQAQGWTDDWPNARRNINRV